MVHQNDDLRKQGIALYKLVRNSDSVSEGKYQSIKSINQAIATKNSIQFI